MNMILYVTQNRVLGSKYILIFLCETKIYSGDSIVGL